MAIPESQLKTWSAIGAQTTSKDTYATVKLALEAEDTGYSGKSYKVFLQGSYGNDTNIWKESDVDVVIRLDSSFTYDISELPADQQAMFSQGTTEATYTYEAFYQDVLDALVERFGKDVVPGTKALKVEAHGNRRKADVIVSFQHRKYSRYDATDGGDYVTGIAFFKSDGSRVVNYPKQHRENMVTKNQNCSEWFKHIVRIFKNARQRMIDDEMIVAGVAPSYYIEGLLYNVPNAEFGTSYGDSVVKCHNWLTKTDKDKLACANMQYSLLHGPADVTWNTADCDKFLDGFAQLWNNWD